MFLFITLLTCLLPVNKATASTFHYDYPGQLDATMFTHDRHRIKANKLLASTSSSTTSCQKERPTSLTNPSNQVITPTTYGADPTGFADSTSAIRLAVQALVSLGKSKDLQGRLNLGGAILDLQGGTYSISSTIAFPSGYGNFKIQRGSLVARSNFTKSSNAYLLQIGSLGKCTSSSGGDNNKNCNTDVSLTELTLDGKNIAFGNLAVYNTMNLNVGPSIYIVGYQGVGINLQGTGAGYIHEAWLGQYQPGTPKPYVSTGTGILLSGAEHDCDVNNVIVFSGLVGVNSTNGANRLQGVHTWNLAGSRGGTGIRLHKGSGRVLQCYLDYAPLVIGYNGFQNGPKIQTESIAQVEGTLFLGSSTIILEANSKNTVASGLIATGNVFHSWNTANRTITLDETNGKFVAVQNVIVENNEVGNNVDKILGKKSTRATSTVKIPSGVNHVTLDFNASLLFGEGIGIAADTVTCQLQGVFPTAISTSVVGNKVTVHLAQVVPDTVDYCAVTCTVDQSSRTSEAH